MSKRISTLLTVAGLLLFTATPAFAQLYVGGGYASGTGDLGDASDPGWMAVAGYLFGLGDGNLSLGPEGGYGSLGSISEGLDSISFFTGMVNLELSFGDGDSASPYIFGGGGIINADAGGDTDSETDFGGQGGVGLGIPVGDIAAWIEGRYIVADGFNLFAILAGIAF